MKWLPSAKTLSELECIQNWITETRVSIMIDCKYDKYAYTIRLQGMANMLRDKWKVIEGEVSEKSKTTELDAFFAQSGKSQNPQN